jgi:predicted CopG family antitoxin|tara:strand:+ start:189 stop:365 length:177 start_codon:yes stop_codon:yes gene_type:complete
MSTRPIKISEETYQTLKMMKQNLFPFPVSFSKVVGYATDKLNEELLYAKEKAKKEKTK